MKKVFFILPLLGLALAAPYTKRIGLYDLEITAPESERRGQSMLFRSRANTQNVVLSYNQTTMRATEVQFNELTNKIYLSGGFHSKYLNNEISGRTLEYDPTTEEIEAYDFTISTLDFYSWSERFSFHDRKMTLYRPTIGLEVLAFSMKAESLDIYPGWGVFYKTTFNWNNRPFWYIPVYVLDKRRNAFELPGAFPRTGFNYFSGNWGRFNNHYYISENSYGNWQFGYSELKGWGYGMQNILRFSEVDQFTYINENWQWWPTSEVFSYEHSFLGAPAVEDENKMTFNELLNYNESIRQTNAHSVRISHTVNEESNVDIINRDIELEYTANFNMPNDWFSIYTVNTYTSLQELTTEREGASLKSYTEFSRGVEIPSFSVVNAGIGYDTVKYSVHPYDWHRIFSFAGTTKRLWIFTWRARAYDYLEDRGNSPFSYDEPYSIGDNMLITSTMHFWGLTLGRTERYIMPRGYIHRMIYSLEYTSRPWTIRLEHNQTDNSWWGGVSATF